MGGKHVRNVLSGSSKDGANSAAMVSILNSAVDHEMVIIDESIGVQRSGVENGGTRGVTNFGAPSKVVREVL